VIGCAQVAAIRSLPTVTQARFTAPDTVEFSVRLVDGVIVVAGEVDLGTAHRVRGVLAIAAHRYERVTVDLSAVTYLDSCGIAVLVGYTPTGLDVVVAPGSSAARILRVTGLDQVLTVHDAGDDIPTRLLDG
jgi:anti-sigma B factor antagonist